MESKRVLSTFPSIRQAVDNIRISQGLEEMAKVMDRGTLIRSLRSAISASFCTRGINTTGTPVRAAAIGRRAAHGRVDREDARAADTGDAAVHGRSGRTWRSARKATRSSRSTRRDFWARTPVRS